MKAFLLIIFHMYDRRGTHGERTTIFSRRPAVLPFKGGAYIQIHLFWGAEFGTFFNRLAGVVSISFVLPEGGKRR